MAAEVGLAKALLFPGKWASLRDNGPASADMAYPVSVELSLTNRCDQNCRWCSDRALRGRSPDRLDMAILDRLFGDLAAGGTRGVTIEGGGEPTLAPFFAEAVAAARDRGLACGLITNGLDLFPAGRDMALYRRFQWVRVSLDAADAGQYAALKGRDGFGAVLGNLARLRQAAPETVVGVGYVLARGNDAPGPLSALARRLAALGVDYLHVRPVVDHPGLASPVDVTFLGSLAAPGFDVNLAALTENAPTGNGGLPCLAHSLSSVIGADGAVWLCGRLNADPDARPLGSLTESSFREIWQGAERGRQTAQAADPAFCRGHCPQCRMTKYNRLLADLARLKTRDFI